MGVVMILILIVIFFEFLTEGIKSDEYLKEVEVFEEDINIVEIEEFFEEVIER